MNEPVFWSPGVTLEAIEKQVILNAFRFYRGNKTQCSISLGISVRTLENKLEKYEQDGKAQREKEQRDERERQDILRRHRFGNAAPPASYKEEQSLHGTDAGVHIQPAVETSSEHDVPVSERQEIQEVLPAKSSAGREQRRR